MQIKQGFEKKKKKIFKCGPFQASILNWICLNKSAVGAGFIVKYRHRYAHNPNSKAAKINFFSEKAAKLSNRNCLQRMKEPLSGKGIPFSPAAEESILAKKS